MIYIFVVYAAGCGLLVVWLLSQRRRGPAKKDEEYDELLDAVAAFQLLGYTKTESGKLARCRDWHGMDQDQIFAVIHQQHDSF